MNYETLEKEIRSKLPKLMELSEGCYLHNDGEKFKIIGIKKSGDYKIMQVDTCLLESMYDSELFLCFDVIGHEIQLNHVLEWFKSKIQEETLVKKIMIGSLIEKWNLESQYLKDQSEELKQYLIELI